MKDIALIDVSVERLSHEGRGIATVNGKVMFIDQALPDEQLRIQKMRQHRRYDEGKMVEVLQASPLRVTPACDHFGVCGGCSLQHMNPEAQIAFKQRFLAEQLQHFGACQPQQWLAPLASDGYGYRRKARLGVRYVDKKQKLLVGFREKNGRYLADIQACSVLEPVFGQKILAFAGLIESLSNHRDIAQLEVAMGDHEAAVIVRHLSAFNEDDLRQLEAFAQAEEFKLFLQPKGLDSIHRLWPKEGDDFLHYSVPSFGVQFDFHPTDFTQVNLAINRLMLDQAIALLDVQPTDRVLDLFCGIGNFSLPIATKAAFVLGVEGDALMVKRATHNAAKNALTNVTFMAADLSQSFEFANGLSIKS
jgi:23S rRNA (uracil1939-C5)-methyltransferase